VLLETVATIPATGLFSFAWLLIAIPLAGAALLLVLGRHCDAWGHWLATACCLAPFIIGVLLFSSMLSADEGQRAVNLYLYDWISAGSWNLGFGLLIDQLSILFVLLITGVGSLIHIYSIGYMAHDERRRRFFAYLNLFIAAMLTLVLADSYLVLFLGWEGVGLASYLLISFWQHKPSAAAAGRKAFVVNRVGDLGMAMAIFTMLSLFGSTAFSAVSLGAPRLDAGTATLLGCLLLVGACGKSAQVPLQSWLLDAMEGPTPVSALIHAATMVTAGVYLVVRSHPIYQVSEAATLAVAIVGVVTLLAGAWLLALHALAPRLARPLGWGAYLLALGISVLGPVARVPQWVLDLSPFTHVPHLPVPEAGASGGVRLLLGSGGPWVGPAVCLVLAVVLLLVAGAAGNRRDLTA